MCKQYALIRIVVLSFFLIVSVSLSAYADEEPFVVELYADGATQNDLNVQAIHFLERVEKDRMRKGIDKHIARNKAKDPHLNWVSSSSIAHAGPYRLGIISVKALYPAGSTSLKYLTVIGIKSETEYRITCSAVGDSELSPVYDKCAKKIKDIFGYGLMR